MTHASDGSGSARDDGGETVRALGWGRDGTTKGVDLMFRHGPTITLTVAQAREVHAQLGTMLANLDALVDDLDALLAAAKARYEAMPPEEREEHDKANRESLARGFSAPCEHGVADWETCPKCRGWSEG